MKTLVLITGTGRSGTSTMSGLLHHLGLCVPGPYLGANESNPRGFFESRWAVKFHKRIAARAGINDFDGRPTALERMQAAITDDDRRDLAKFLSRFDDEAQIVVKDPRSVWTQQLWREVALEAGRDVKYLSMLRHPAEVVGSRVTYYADDSDEEKRRRYETFTITRWVNASLVNEHETRGFPRAFVRYVDLLADWRSVVDHLVRQWDLDLDLTGPGADRVDEFVDPDLRRHVGTWDDVHVPDSLREIADPVWTSLDSLVLGDGENPVASARLDEEHRRFEELFREASAMSHDATQEARAKGFAEGLEAGRGEARATALLESGSGRDPAVADSSGRELVSELAARATKRARAIVRRPQ